MNPLNLTKFSDVQVSLLPEAITQRDAALERAAKITSVADDGAQAECAEYLRALKSIAKSVEDGRTFVKSPVLELGRKIDAFAKEFVSKVEIETSRLTRLLSAYQAEQQRKAAEAERIRQEEIRRQEAERQRIEALERKQREEAQRAAIEAQRKAEAEFLVDTEADAAKARKAAEEALRKAKEEADKLILQQKQKAEAESTALTLKTTAPIKATKAAGMSVATVWKFEVTDLNALVKSRPELCRIEPNTSAINRELGAGIREIAGLRIWSETVANVR